MSKKKVLFVCIGNMCRSPMAEGFARKLGSDVVDAYSAGTNPTGVVSEDSIELMEEIGIDITHQRSNGFDSVPLAEMDIVINMSPAPPKSFLPPGYRGSVIAWKVDDPIGRSLDTFRRVRDELDAKVRALLDDIRRGDA